MSPDLRRFGAFTLTVWLTVRWGLPPDLAYLVGSMVALAKLSRSQSVTRVLSSRAVVSRAGRGGRGGEPRRGPRCRGMSTLCCGREDIEGVRDQQGGRQVKKKNLCWPS